MREVQASCSSDLDLGQAGRAREGGGGLSVFYWPMVLIILFPDFAYCACDFSVQWPAAKGSKCLSNETWSKDMPGCGYWQMPLLLLLLLLYRHPPPEYEHSRH